MRVFGCITAPTQLSWGGADRGPGSQVNGLEGVHGGSRGFIGSRGGSGVG